jgi:hypothetical protein
MSDTQSDNLKFVYDKLCTSYHAIDDFRAKLLGFLPLASGAGIFLLLNDALADPTKSTFVRLFILPIGIFGFVITLGLFFFEIYGIEKCHALIMTGKQLEYALGVGGQFTHRPREVARVINEPFATGIIYPAVLAAWSYIGLFFVLSAYAGWIAVAVFSAGFVGTYLNNRRLKRDGVTSTLIHINQQILRAEEEGDEALLGPLLHPDFTIVRASGEKQDRPAFLKAVQRNKNLGRTAEQMEVRQYGDWAVFTCRITTTHDKEGKEVVGHFWNTRLFLLQDKAWRCATWQVAKFPLANVSSP